MDLHRQQKPLMVGPLLGGCVLAIPQQIDDLGFDAPVQASRLRKKMRRDGVWNCRGDLVDPPRASAWKQGRERGSYESLLDTGKKARLGLLPAWWAGLGERVLLDSQIKRYLPDMTKM